MQDQDPLVSKTLQKIKDDHIKPASVWKISINNYFFWSLFFFMILLSSFSLSLIIHLTYDVDWDLYSNLRESRWRYMLSVLPYFWIILLILFSLLSYINIRQTKKGYRYETIKVFGIIMGLTIGIGSLIFTTKADDQTHQAFCNNFSSYNNLSFKKEKVWNQPELGLLAGRIMAVENNSYDLEDFKGQRWNVIPAESMVVKTNVALQKDLMIKVIGTKAEQCCQFYASEIRPWAAEESKEQENCDNCQEEDREKIKDEEDRNKFRINNDDKDDESTKKNSNHED